MPTRLEIPLGRPLPPGLLEDLLSRLAYVSEHITGYESRTHDDGMVTLLLDLDGPADRVREDVMLLVERMAAGYRPVEKIVLWKSPCRSSCQEDVFARMLATGEAVPEGTGVFSCGPLVARCMRRLRGDLERLAHLLDAQERLFPDLVSIELLEKCGCFESFPHHLGFASRPVRDLQRIRELHLKPSGDDGSRITQALAPPSFALQPAVCYHCYGLFAGQELDCPQTLTCEGACYRYEGIRFVGLRRLQSFHMREFVFLGPGPFAETRRQRTIELVRELAVRWGLEARIETATDPFFVDAYPSKRFFQLATRAKYELRAKLPHDGGDLAVASFNIHQDFFARPLDIRFEGQHVHTACTAFGLERWVYAFLAQYGLDSHLWPDELRDSMPG